MFSNNLKNDFISREHYEITINKERNIKKYSAKEVEYLVKFKNIPVDMIESLELIEKVFRSILRDIILYTRPRDKIKIFIHHPNLNEDIKMGRFQSNFINVSDIDPDFIIDTIVRLAQSGKIITLDERLTFNVLIINYIEGSGKRNNDRLDNYFYKKQCVVRIATNKYDSLCGLRAIIVGKAIADKSENYEKIRDSRNSCQSDLVKALADELSLDYNQPIGISELVKIEAYLKYYQFIIIDGDNLSTVLYAGVKRDKKIFLHLKNHHYDCIKSLPALFQNSYYCFECFKPYSVYELHPCNDVCKKCKDRFCQFVSVDFNVKCEFCEVNCKSQECLIRHKSLW